MSIPRTVCFLLIVFQAIAITANFAQGTQDEVEFGGGMIGVVALKSPDGATFGPREVRQSQSKNLLAVSTSQGTNLYRVGVEGGVSFFATVPKTPSGYGKQPLSLSGDLLVIGRESEAAYVYRIQADNTVKFLANATGATVGQSTAKSPASSPGWFARETSLSDDLLAVSEHGEGVVYLYRITEDGGVAFLSKVKPPSSMTTVSRFGESISLSGDLLAATGGNNRTFLYRIEPNGNATYLNLVDKAGIADAGNISLSGDVLAIKPSSENKAFLYRVEADGTISEIQQLSNLASDSTRVSVTGDLLAAPPYLYRLQSNGDLIDLVELTGVGGISTPLDSRREMYALGANFIAAGGNVHFDSSWTPTVKIATVSLPYAGGSVTGGGQVFEGWSATLTANPAEKYTFTGWTGDFTGKDNPLTLKAVANMTVIANFLPTETAPPPVPSYSIVTTSTLGGTVTGGGIYPENAPVTITANPTPGYVFAKWSEDASGNTNPLRLTATENLGVTAVFEVIYDSPRIAGSVELVGGWWNSSWFGNFFEARSGWIYHEDQGWFFPVESGIDSYWLWDEFLGWIWTSKEAVPYFYDHDDSKWLYLGNYSSGRRVAYDFESKTWSILPHTTPKSTSKDGTQTNSGQTGTGSNSQPIGGTDFASTKTALANASSLAEAINIVNSSTKISEDSKYTIMFELTFYGESKELTRLGLSLGFK